MFYPNEFNLNPKNFNPSKSELLIQLILNRIWNVNFQLIFILKFDHNECDPNPEILLILYNPNVLSK